MKYKLKRTGIWAFMLTKRIFKKPAFLIILLLIPLVAFSFSVIAQEDSGFVTVVLCDTSKEDGLSRELISELTENTSLIRFIKADSEERARQLVMAGKADAAWIFPDNLKVSIDEFTKNPTVKNSFIRIIQKEDSMFLKISREKLTGVFFESLSESAYINYLRSSSPELSHYSDEELMNYYFDVATPETLFEFEYLDSDTTPDSEEPRSYLITPLRGLMAILTVLGGLATSLFFMKDKSSGLFSWVPLRLHAPVEFAYQIISTLSVCVAVTFSLILTDVYGAFRIEFMSMIMLILSSCAFCMLVRILSGKLRNLSILLPLLVITMITMCPVFFTFRVARLIKFIFPPTYYLSAQQSPVYLIYGLIYTLILFGIYALIKHQRET